MSYREHTWTAKSEERYVGKWQLECCGTIIRGSAEGTVTHTPCSKCKKARVQCYFIGSHAWTQWVLGTHVVADYAEKIRMNAKH